jgi:hypothetical protein
MSYRSEPSSEAQQTPISEMLANRLNNLDEQFHRVHNDFRDMAERLLGPVPTPVPGGLEQGRKASPNTALTRIEDTINSLEQVSAQLRDDYNRLRVI